MLDALDAGPFRVTRKQYDSTFRQGSHAHEVGAVDFNLAGSGRGVYGGQEVESTPGEVEFFAPGREHSFEAGPRGMRTLHVSFGPGVLGDTALDLDDPARRHIDQATAAGLGVRILRELSDPDASSALGVESMCHQLVAASVRWRDRPEGGARWLAWVRERLHAGGAASLDELAALAGVHRAHLARSFAARYGVSVGEYERRVRLAGAAARLARDGEPLARVAREAGFADQAHLTRWFTRVLGTTPGAFVRVMRAERDGL